MKTKPKRRKKRTIKSGEQVARELDREADRLRERADYLYDAAAIIRGDYPLKHGRQPRPRDDADPRDPRGGAR